jgi:hypothetical protein
MLDRLIYNMQRWLPVLEPSRADKFMLAKKTGMTYRQIHTWTFLVPLVDLCYSFKIVVDVLSSVRDVLYGLKDNCPIMYHQSSLCDEESVCLPLRCASRHRV